MTRRRAARAATKSSAPVPPRGTPAPQSTRDHGTHGALDLASASWILRGDNLDALRRLPAGFARLVYVDPPFNTGRMQKRARIQVRSVAVDGDRGGFSGRRYRTRKIASERFEDRFEDEAYLDFLLPRIEAAWRCLSTDGSLFVHLDYREVHHVKVALDGLLGRARFQNEIVWAYDYGARSRTRWPCKHDTILWYAVDPARYVFDYEAMDRIPYLAPELVTPEKARRGKTPTDVWWHTIVPTNGKEKTGYPTQKPLGVLNRIVRVHTQVGDYVLDAFAGSGTTGEAAATNARRFVLVDSHPGAVRIMRKRLARFDPRYELVRTTPAPRARPGRAPKPVGE